MSYDVRPPLFGSPIVTAIARSSYLTETGLVIPGIVARCFQEINKDLKVEGLFRRSGSASVLNQLQCQFEQSDDPFQVEPSIPVTVHYWTGLLKRYLQLLPEPLIPQCKQPLFLEALDSGLPIEKFRVAMESMPLEHHHLLKYLLQSIRVVTDYSSANHMSASAMAIIVAPTFVHIDAISQLMQQSTPALEPIPLSSWRKATQRLLSVTVRKRSSNKQLVSSMSTHSVPFPLYQPQHILQLDLVKQSSQWANTIEYLILNVHFFIARKPKKKTLKTTRTSPSHRKPSVEIGSLSRPRSNPTLSPRIKINLANLEFPESRELLDIFQDIHIPRLTNSYLSAARPGQKYVDILKHWRAREEQELRQQNKNATTTLPSEIHMDDPSRWSPYKKERSNSTKVKNQLPSEWLRLWSKKSLMMEPTVSSNIIPSHIQLYQQ